MTYVDIDDTVRATHGYLKQGSGFGYTGVSGLNVLLGVISTPFAALAVADTRLRKGSANSARGTARLIADTLVTPRAWAPPLGAARRCCCAPTPRSSPLTPPWPPAARGPGSRSARG